MSLLREQWIKRVAMWHIILDGDLDEHIEKAADQMIHAIKRGKKLLIFGNGGSAAEAQHFAAELVLELVYRKLAGVEKIGAHIAADKARIDFLWSESVTALLPELQAEARAVVAADLKIESAFRDAAEERRYWKIEGFSEVPCGGTHLKRTAEIGEIRLKRVNIGKGKERIEIFVDMR